MSLRDWVAEKLRVDYTIEFEGEHDLRIERGNGPVGLVYCAEMDGVGRFTTDDLDAAGREMPGLQFVVLIRRYADNEAYERAEQVGICLGGLGDLKSALSHDSNIADHLSSGQAYLLRRLQKNRYVVSVRRCGKSAYEVSRKAPMPPLIVVATEEYELTSDGVYELLDEYDGIVVHAIVSTNPACFGFAGEVLVAGEQTGTRVFSLNRLLDALGDTWA